MYSLVIDCSHKENFIGLFKDNNQWLCKQIFLGQPFEDLMINLKSMLFEFAIDQKEITHFYTPNAPGSTLGIRLTQMVIETLLRTSCQSAKFTQYNGLYVSALSLLESGIAFKRKNHYLITEKGRHFWNVIKIDENLKISPIIQQYSFVDLEKLAGEFFYIAQMKTWSAPPVKAKELNYSPENFLKYFELLNQLNLDTSLLLPQSNSYVKWRHNHN